MKQHDEVNGQTAEARIPYSPCNKTSTYDELSLQLEIHRLTPTFCSAGSPARFRSMTRIIYPCLRLAAVRGAGVGMEAGRQMPPRGTTRAYRALRLRIR